MGDQNLLHALVSVGLSLVLGPVATVITILLLSGFYLRLLHGLGL